MDGLKARWAHLGSISEGFYVLRAITFGQVSQANWSGLDFEIGAGRRQGGGRPAERGKTSLNSILIQTRFNRLRVAQMRKSAILEATPWNNKHVRSDYKTLPTRFKVLLNGSKTLVRHIVKAQTLQIWFLEEVFNIIAFFGALGRLKIVLKHCGWLEGSLSASWEHLRGILCS